MICTKKEFIRTGADGTKWWQVVLTSDTDPDSLNLTGADVENLNDALGLAAGSILITPTANYIAFEDGVFTLKSSGGGGDADPVAIESAESNDFDFDGITPIKYSDVDPGDSIGLSFSTFGTISEGVYDFTITPGAESYLYDVNENAWGGKGEPVTLSLNYEGGDFEFIDATGVTTDVNDPDKAVNVDIFVSSIL